MKKTTKGAFAAGAAAVLLLGGAGSLAYWNATASVGGGTVTSGKLALTDTTTNGCAAATWTIDSAENPKGAAFNPASDLLVPGDVVTKTCTYTLVAAGTHLRATLAATGGTLTGDLAPALTASATFHDDTAGSDVTTITSQNNNDKITATISLTFAGSSDNTTQNVSAALSNYAITLTQAHA